MSGACMYFIVGNSEATAFIGKCIMSLSTAPFNVAHLQRGLSLGQNCGMQRSNI